ncbi:MAG: DUF2298 domain-containing protein [Chloroflexota bacterium]|nr:DUF2298 domain-containing protein [Chloroflexota bacterium]
MLDFVLWYLTLTLFALAALPLGWTWLRHLPDRGWGLLRPLGLLLVGVAVWFLGSFGLLRLNVGSGLGGLAALFGVGVWALHRWGGGWEALRAWLREHRALVLTEEALFFVAFAFWVWYRVHETMGIAHTEQPMDFALMNAILRGGEMPPNDPWLSGFAISYYYLGYLIMAQLAALSGVPSGVAYNLGLMTLAAMAAVASFSIAYNLVIGELRSRRVAMGVSLLAPLLLVGISNLTGLLTMVYHRGLGPDALYNWLNVVDLTVDPVSGERSPQSGWWWWPASRTLSYLDPNGIKVDVIDEFPFFSFMLGDMHPHVLALPFALLAVAVALNALRGALAHPVVRQIGALNLPPEAWGVNATFGKLALGLVTVLLGAFAMLNTWDMPTVATIIAGVWLIAAVVGRKPGEGRSALIGWLGAVAFLLGGALLLYLPFYAGFSSQAEGIRVSPFTTPPQQYLLMFGLFWLVLLPLALSQLKDVAEALRTVRARVMAVTGAMLLVDVAVLFFLLRLNVAEERLGLLMAGAWLLIPLALFSFVEDDDPTPLAIVQMAGFPLLIGLAMQRWTMALVAALLGLILLALWTRVRALVPGLETETSRETLHTHPVMAGGSQEATPEAINPHSALRTPHSALIFALGIAAVALLLTMGPEMFYLKDGFGGRMNTIFKLYYQAWALMSLATVFGVVYLVKRAPKAFSMPWIALFALLLLASTWYPIEALRSKADFDGPLHWDGRFWMQTQDPDRFAAIQWLDALPGQVVVLERPGDQYNATHSALAGWTGHSTLVGWGGHELQWRGTYEEVARREPVIAEIYQTTDPSRAKALLEQWNIDYVALTPAEIAHYNLTEQQIDKFYDFMTPAFQQGTITIFGR